MLITTLILALATHSYADTALYVDANNGNDAWDGSSPSHTAGTIHGPWASVQRAQAGASSVLSHGGSGTLTVNLAAGSYALDASKPLQLGSNDSPRNGFTSVVWRGPLGSLCTPQHVPGNFTAVCREPTAAEAAVLDAGVQLSWRAVTAQQAQQVVAAMAPDAPAAAQSTGLVAAASAGQLFVGVPPAGAALARTQPAQLYDEAGKPQQRARFPALGQFSVWAEPLCKENLHKPSACAQRARFGFVYNQGTVLPSYVAANHTRFVVYHGWTASSHQLDTVTPANETVTFVNPSDRPIGWWPNHDSEGGGRFFVEALEYLTASTEGAWAWSDVLGGALFVGKVQPSDAWRLSRLLTAVNVTSGAHDIALEGLSVRHTGGECDAAGGQVCDRQSTDWQRNAAVLVSSGASRVAVRQCEVAGASSYAVWAASGSSDVAISSNYLRELGAGGVRVGSSTGARNSSWARRVMVQDSVVRRGGLDFASGTGILVQFANNCSISHNDVGFLAYAGLSIGWSWDFAQPSGTADILVEGNHIHDLGVGTFRQLGDAMAAIYTLGVQPGTVVRGNFGHDVYASYTGGYGLSQDQGSSEMLFENNVMYRINAALWTQHYGVNNTFRNNILVDGMVDSVTLENSPAIRTVPRAGMPNSFTFEGNVVAWSNSSNDALAFNGEYIDAPSTGSETMSAPSPSSAWSYVFASNVYHPGDANAAQKAIWGGCTKDCAGEKAFKLTWAQWTGGCGTAVGSSPQHCTGPKQDVGSTVADPLLADPAAFNFTLLDGSPALQRGFRQISLQSVGIRG